MTQVDLGKPEDDDGDDQEEQEDGDHLLQPHGHRIIEGVEASQGELSYHGGRLDRVASVPCIAARCDESFTANRGAAPPFARDRVRHATC